jgi:putative transposase
MMILRMLSRVYFTEVVTFAVMSNHSHLIVRMIPEGEVSAEELVDRFHLYYVDIPGARP